MRVRALSALLAAVALVLAGCSSQDSGGDDNAASASWSLPSTDPTATVRVLGFLDPVADGTQKVFDAFQKAHPTIKLQYEHVPFDQLNSVTEARISNKQGNPDVLWADMPRIPALAARGYLDDITAQFKQYTSAFDPAPVKATTVEGKLYALPIANSTQLLFYNRTALAKAGLKPPSADPKTRITWEQLSADAAKAKADGGAQYGLVFGQWDRYYQLQPLPMSLGGGNGAASNDPLKPEVTTPQWVKAFEWYGKQFADGTSPRGVPTEQNDALFAAGKIAYMVEGPWLLPQLSKAKVDWGVAAHPMFEGGKPVTPTGSWSLALNPYSKNKPAAGVFLKWMAIDGGSGYTTNLPAPELPANVKGKSSYFARPVFATPEGKKAAVIIDYETANTAVNRVPTVGFIEFEDIIGRAFADIRNGTPAKTALDKAQADINTAWAKYR